LTPVGQDQLDLARSPRPDQGSRRRYRDAAHPGGNRGTGHSRRGISGPLKTAKIDGFPMPSSRLAVTTVLIIPGSSVLSDFRRDRLLRTLAARGLPVADVHAHACHFVGIDGALGDDDQARLQALLDDGRTSAAAGTDKHAASFLVIPRLGTISPWASKAT